MMKTKPYVENPHVARRGRQGLASGREHHERQSDFPEGDRS